MAEWDLTTRLGKYLDKHLVFPLLEFLSVKEVRHDYQLIHSVVIYEENEILEGKLELLSNTNMVDFALDVYKRLHEDVEPPQHLFDKRQDVVSQMKHLQVQTGPMLEILLKDEVQSEIEKSRDSRLLYELLQTKHDTARADPSFSLMGFATFTRIVLPKISASFMLSMAVMASSADSNSTKANPLCFWVAKSIGRFTSMISPNGMNAEVIIFSSTSSDSPPQYSTRLLVVVVIVWPVVPDG
ncbi:unnamed protein product [Oppiella nova]|uniref:Eukaryotic translation initiation factor 3 subunit E N-terminal domain-containing protein n=1 Tax=Oppiella nova TaxID=334625 RepID=A0A7R9QJC9_9ACAR|nr:unnamed protein product [Oppiella nova]CAG2166878.1 unnamed protein product [Oppiella nova]